ncbi:MAG: peptidylprolyl isomerase [Gammaproteobacteria bacterium RIFCSPHIGHO2_12_FULL_35_23]|nr:MAG: peptidylprolyl isomerase [Gammaproteobacteria bacterium RIFCSPHIGHO2_12_FULL_35_23]
MVILETNKGTIKLELDYKKTPNTAKNFEEYVKDGFYEGVIFHRVINNFMIQGGGFLPGMKQKQTKSVIKNEANKGSKNVRGSIAMARTMDPHSASAQFFINVKDNEFLNFKSEDVNGWGYCVFGKVVEGMEVVDLIKAVKTTSKAGHDDVPSEDIVIEKATVI